MSTPELIEQVIGSGLFSFDDEPYFSWQGCEHCADGLGATVYDLQGYAVWKTGNSTNSESAVTALTGCITARRKTNMRTKITFYGEITGKIWMPAVECTKAFCLELTRIPRNSKTRTYPGIAPRSVKITCLGDALLHLTNDGDFQSCAITWARLEVSHYFGDETAGARTVKIRTRMWELHGKGHDADCFVNVRS